MPVSRSRRFTSYLMLFIFGFLSVKSLLSNGTEGVHDDCQEFAHIHMYKSTRNHQGKLNISAFEGRATKADGDDDDCHEGKSVLSYSPFPAAVFDIVTTDYKIVYDLIFSLENNFKSPDLEPQRKPPRNS